MKNFLILTLLFPLFVGAQAPKFQTSWESPSTRNTGMQLVEDVSPDTGVILSTAWSRSGTKSIKFGLKNTDPEPQYGNKRREITIVNNVSNGSVDSSITWYRWSNYFPSIGNENDTREDIFTQWHDKSSSCSASPTLSFETYNGNIRVWIRWSTGNYCTNTGSRQSKSFIIAALPKDKAIDWVVNYVPRTDGNGRVQIWMTVDGVRTQVLNYQGPCQYIGSQFPYWKVGIYKWVWMQSLPLGKPNYRMHYIDMLAYGNSSNTLESMSLPGNPPPPPNQAPTITSLSSNDNYIAGTTSAALNVVANDPESGPLTYLWAKVSGAGSQIISNGTTASASVSGLADGNSYVFRVTVTDNQAATVIGTKSITIATANNAPVANAGISRQLSLDQDTVHLDGEATDVEDVDCCTIHTWSLVSGPNTPTFTPTDWNPVVTNLIEGTYVFKLSITDSGGLTSESTVSYTVPHFNQIPTIQPSPPVVRVRSETTATIGFLTNDPDGPHPTILISQVSGPNTAGITSTTSDTTGLTGLAIGTYIFRGIATDNKAATAQATVTVIVNNPPTVDLTGNTTVNYPSGTPTYNAVSSPADTDGTVSSGTWTIIQKPVSAADPSFTDASADNTTINGLEDGIYIFRREVIDNDGVSGYNDLTLTISTTRLIVPKIRFRPI
jgi:Polysaccharide lyase